MNNAIHVRLPRGSPRSHNPVIDVVVASCLDPEVIFRNSAHSSRVIYDRDPGAGPGSRAFSTESVNDQGKTS